MVAPSTKGVCVCVVCVYWARVAARCQWSERASHCSAALSRVFVRCKPPPPTPSSSISGPRALPVGVCHTEARLSPAAPRCSSAEELVLQ